jgi:hypothetical protein
VFSVVYVGLSTTKVYFAEKELAQLEEQQRELKKMKEQHLEKEAEKIRAEDELSRMENGMRLPNITMSASGQIEIEGILFDIQEAVPMSAKLYDAEYKKGALRVRGVTRNVASVAQMASAFSKEYQVYIGNVQEITHNEEGYIPFSILLALDRTSTKEEIEALFKEPLEGEMPPVINPGSENGGEQLEK